MALTFESLWNVSTQKAITVGDDGLLRQYAEDRENRAQHWLRLHQQNPMDGTFKITSRVSGKVIDINMALLVVSPFSSLTPNPTQRWNLVSTEDGTDNFYVLAGDSQQAWTVLSEADGEQIYLL